MPRWALWLRSLATAITFSYMAMDEPDGAHAKYIREYDPKTTAYWSRILTGDA